MLLTKRKIFFICLFVTLNKLLRLGKKRTSSFVLRTTFRNFAPMIIGYDAKRIVRNGTGLGSYARTLVNDLIVKKPADTRLLLYAPDMGRDDLRSQINEGVEWHYEEKFAPLIPKGIQKAYWRTHSIVKDLKRDKVEIFHGLSGELPIGLRKAGIRGVVTIHDLIFMRHPEWYNPIDVKFYTWKFYKTVQEADRIIAISECTKRDIMELGGVEEERIDLIYQSYSPKFKDGSAGTQGYEGVQRYVLYVGTVEERKNLLLAVKALDMLPEDIHLVAVGRLTDYAKRIPHHERLHLLGQLPLEELTALYAGAEAFVYPSRYEGFGIPIIEAISSGLPVVACTGSCLEEAGGPDCLYVNPDDHVALADALRSVLKGADSREERIRKSREYIRRFEGGDVASQVLDVYQNL